MSPFSRALTFAARTLGSVMLTFALLFPVTSVFAQGFNLSNTGLPEAGTKAGCDVNQVCVDAAGGCIPHVLGQVVSALLAAVGALFVVLILYGGVQYMTAGGDSKKVEAATLTIRNAILGILVIAASYAIVSFVLDSVDSATTSGGDSGSVIPSE